MSIIANGALETLDLSDLRVINAERCETVFHPVDDWTPAEWAVALAGEGR